MDGAGVPAKTLDTIKKAFAKALGKSGPNALSAMEAEFISLALEDYAADETPELNTADFAAVLAEFWRFSETHNPKDGPKIRIRQAVGASGKGLNFDVVEIVQDDAPFLVDSVMGELGEQGVSVRSMFHPLLMIDRSAKGKRGKDTDGVRESTILVVADPLGEDRRQMVVQGLKDTLADVREAVRDWTDMSGVMHSAIEGLEKAPKGVDKGLLDESIAFLRWLEIGNFVFLGAREYAYPRTEDGGYSASAPLDQSGRSLGVLSNPDRAILRQTSEQATLTPQVRRQIDLAEPVTVAKANIRSRVHRRGYMDYVGVKRYGADGRPTGEIRFVGLFTAEAYDQTASSVPLIRRKVANVLARAGKAPGSHNQKRLKNIVENYPRDELFQMTENDLLRIALGVLHLFDRPRVKLFTRRDPFDRFVSVLMYVPRERYDAGMRERAGQIIADAWGGRLSAWYPQLGDAPLVRIHYIVGLNPGDHLEPDEAAIERAVTETSRSWAERFSRAARAAGMLDAQLSSLTGTWAEAFPVAYRDRYAVEESLTDLGVIDQTQDEGVKVRAFRNPSDTQLQFRFKLYWRGAEPVPLADVVPILEDMGLKALEEYSYCIKPTGAKTPVWVHEFQLEDPRGAGLSFDAVKGPFEAAFEAVWSGRTESDGFNRLVVELGVDWREAALVRALCRYRQQSGLDPSQAVQEEALRDHPEVARLLLELFTARFDPAAGKDAASREKKVSALWDRMVAALQAVSSLDQDRALRRLALLVQAIKRTNYYQPGPDGAPKPYISFKVASRELADLPLPKPYREIFVWAPHVEGVHLRFGPVARGGLRWSDRRDDFRTEVLGLVKAQQVKNAVIVPNGSKGGFYPKQLPRPTDRDAWLAEGIRSYKTFLSGLLDLTDNLDAAGKVVPPANVVRWDQDDPYLVVAADKGTATFSDIANSVSADYGFWLGDAFASGGSVGYDHKAMGITARGAWEAVKRHFREMGKDIQSEPFTVAGVGDMSGDVFGNGMLLSKAIRLVAAFDHRDIFLDPNPDPARSWVERKRVFDLPRSSWNDYDKKLISKGGGVFSRSLKEIPLSKEVREVLGVTETSMAPSDLMHAILKAPVELLYFGGIGTYIKAPAETHADAGDKANDAIRVDGPEVRARVIGEGANLGLTQAGRIAYARAGGRLNTDAIDNSAGVDTSDHEVNIKILTGQLEAKGKLSRDRRNKLLASMTETVGLHVLKHNYDQTLALSLQEQTAAYDLDAHERFMFRLVGEGKLDRKVEGLPGPVGTKELMAQKLGLTRPELAVLTAYGKLELKDDLVASKAPDDPFHEATLKRYFPKQLGAYEAAMKSHRLRREIISTVIANELVNMAGPTFPGRLRDNAQCDTTALITAFEAARQVFRLDEAWGAVSALDLKIPAEAQLALYQEISRVVRRQTYWLARRVRTKTSVQTLIDAYRPAADALRKEGARILSAYEQDAVARRAAAFVAKGAPQTLADAVAVLRPLTATSDVADLAKAVNWSVVPAARLYHQVGEALHFDRLRAATGMLPASDHYERVASRRLIEDLLTEQADLTRSVAKGRKEAVGKKVESARDAVSDWMASRQKAVDLARATVSEIEAAGDWTFAKLTIVNAALRELVASA
ncbi:MAG: NAD-glutamate dehydrogenase [Caulobacteraceae bacterium]|nr:NAD-glutamate dehydrogenase [Caulobacteraceae bacterium]